MPIAVPETLNEPMLPYFFLEQLLGCACEALDRFTSGGCPERACVYNGSDVVAFDDCCDGQLWAVWQRTIPTDWSTQAFGIFPNRAPRASSLNAKCFTLIAYDFEIGILRCAPTIDAQGNMPDCDEIDASAKQVHEDAWVILRSVLCCLKEFGDAGFYVAWEQQEPVEDQGACVGSRLRFSLGHEICPCIELPEVEREDCPDPEDPCAEPEPPPEPPPPPPEPAECQPTVPDEA